MSRTATTTSSLRDLTPYLLYLLFTAAIGPLLFGYHLAELNAPSEVITCASHASASTAAADRGHALSRLAAAVKDKFHPAQAQTQTRTVAPALPQCIPMTPLQFGLVSSFFTLGGLVGALGAGPMSSHQGKLRTMIWTAGVATLGPVFEAVAPSIAILTVGRFVSGVAAGAAMVVIPIYIAEIAPPGKKGFFGSVTQVMVNVGILATQVLGLFLSRGNWWRVILGASGAIAMLQGVGLVLGGEESPKWMTDHGKPGRAKKVLRKMRGHRADIDAEVEGWGIESSRDIEDEEETLLAHDDRVRDPPTTSTQGADGDNAAADHDTTAPSKITRSTERATMSVISVLRNPQTSPAVLAVVVIMLAQQFTGINSIIMYGVSLLSDLLEANSALLNVAVSGLNVVITASAAPLVDKLGRKTCLLLSTAGMGTMSVLLGIGIMFSIPALSAVAVVLFVASFGLGLGPIPFILSSELVGPEAVGATQSLALAASWIATFVVAQFFPIVNETMGKGQVYFLFAGLAVFFGTFIACWVPETKGKSSIDEVWGRKKGRSGRED